MALALSRDGAEILTTEGFAGGEVLHPVQPAFIKHGALQCSFCTLIQIISAVGLIAEGQVDDDLERVRQGMSGNLCRCDAYRGITDAVIAASRTFADTAQETTV